MFCSKCGFKSVDGAKFCVNCGAHLDYEGSVKETTTSQAPETHIPEPKLSDPELHSKPNVEAQVSHQTQPSPGTISKKGPNIALIIGCGCIAAVILIAILAVGGWFLAKGKIAALFNPKPTISVKPVQDSGTEKSRTEFGIETDPKFVTAVMCKSLKSDQSPDETSNSFSTKDKFYCSVEVTDVEPGDIITAKWYRRDQLIKEYPYHAKSSKIDYIGFSLSLDRPWPTGDDYKVEIYMNKKLVNVLPFSVASEGDTLSLDKTINEEWASYLEDAVICESLDDAQSPVNPKTIFGTHDIFYISLIVKDLPPNSNITTKWYYGTQFIADAQIPTTSGWSGYVGFHCKPKTKWPVGDYSVEIYFNDKLVCIKEFQVE